MRGIFLIRKNYINLKKRLTRVGHVTYNTNIKTNLDDKPNLDSPPITAAAQGESKMSDRNQTTSQDVIAQLRSEVGVRLFNIALAWSKKNMLKKDQIAEIKACTGRKKVINGSKSIAAAWEATSSLSEMIRGRRRQKQKRIVHNQTIYKSINRGHKTAFWNTSIDSRLKNHKKREFDKVFARATYRVDAASTVRISINDGDTTTHQQSEYLDWNYYSKSTKYPKKLVSNTFFVARNYKQTVIKEGIAIVDGLMTLNAKKMVCKADCDLYQADWLEQGRGYDIHTVSGFIAKSGPVAYHADTAKKAVAGLQRKLKAKGLVIKFEHGLKSPIVKALVDQYADRKITKADAKKAGACVSGTRSWCSKIGVDYDSQDSMTVREVYEAWVEVPAPEVKAIMIAAFKRMNIA